MSALLLKGGRVIDPAAQRDEICDVLIEDGVIRQVGKDLSTDGAEVYMAAVDAMSEEITYVLDSCGIDPERIDQLVCHQANGRIMAAVARRLRWDSSKVLSYIDRYGNTSAASIPITLAVGQPADLVVIDLDKVACIEPESFLSKGRNTPYAGQEVYGWPILTISQGRIAYQDSAFFA